MTYNFDPDRWYERERLRLELERRQGRIDDAGFDAALADLDRRHEEMLERLDGTYQLPEPG